VGGGIRSLNVTLRQVLDLYACIRPVRYIAGVPSPVREPQRVDVVIFRENTEDVYAGIEWKGGTPEADQVRRFLVEEMGADMVTIHCAIDEQMEGKDPFEMLRKVADTVSIPLGVAGGINSETAAKTVAAGASIVIVGGAITKALDPEKAAREIRRGIDTGESIRTTLFKRKGEKQIREVLELVSAANLSDALHRGGVLQGIRPLARGLRMVGRAVTVRTYPGDWSKPVQAIDAAGPGDVIVIDAGGVGPAIWGELATHSAIQRGVAGVVIDGAIRDSDDIVALKFPAFSKLVMPNAGEPKGFGEIGVPVTVANVKVEPGDWLLGDGDGVVVLPSAMAVEYANRAMDVLERENRIREEIKEGSTLSKVTELVRWEKQGRVGEIIG